MTLFPFVLLSLFLLTLGDGAFAASGSNDCLLVPESRISFGYEWTRLPWETSRFEEHANFGHEVEPGDGTVIVLRAYEPGNHIDAGQFTKVTLEFHNPEMRSPLDRELVVSPSRSYFSEGNSAFADSGSYWRAKDPTGVKVRLTPSNAGIHIAMFIEIQMTLVNERVGPMLKRFDFNCDLKIKAVTALHPWEGKPDQSFSVMIPPTTSETK